MLLLAGLAALALGLLVALALRGRAAPLSSCWRRWPSPARRCAVLVLYLLVPPRGELADPEYYANGPDIPAALRAIDGAQELGRHDLRGPGRPARGPRAPDRRARGAGSGLAAPAADPGIGPAQQPAGAARAGAGGGRRAAGVRRRPDRPGLAVRGRAHRPGGPCRETRWCSWRATTTPTRWCGACGGRAWSCSASGSSASPGCGWRAIRRRTCACESERYRDRGAEITDAQRQEFADWLRPLVGKVDVVVAHEQGIAETAAGGAAAQAAAGRSCCSRATPTSPSPRRRENLVELNGGSAGGGGTGNLADDQPFGHRGACCTSAAAASARASPTRWRSTRTGRREGGAAAGGRRALGALAPVADVRPATIAITRIAQRQAGDEGRQAQHQAQDPPGDRPAEHHRRIGGVGAAGRGDPVAPVARDPHRGRGLRGAATALHAERAAVVLQRAAAGRRRRGGWSPSATGTGIRVVACHGARVHLVEDAHTCPRRARRRSRRGSACASRRSARRR